MSVDRPPHTRWRAFVVSLEGLKDAIRTQQAFRLELALAVPTLLGGWLREFAVSRWLFVIAMIGVLLATELLNTALEVKCDDQYGPEFNVVVKRVKDLGSAAVLMMVIAAVTGYTICLIWPH